MRFLTYVKLAGFLLGVFAIFFFAWLIINAWPIVIYFKLAAYAFLTGLVAYSVVKAHKIALQKTEAIV